MFLESIAFRDGEAPLMEYHCRRVSSTLTVEKSRKDLSGQERKTIEASLSILLSSLTSLTSPSLKGLFKCRVVYDPYHIERKTVEFLPYEKQEIRSLRLVDGGAINYDRKYSNRKKIDTLYQEKGGADDILIVRQGLITDSSYCNIIFSDGKGWVTPATPLLAGVQRAHLLDQGIIREERLKVEDLSRFLCFKLVNALRKFDEAEEVKIENILSGDLPIL